MVEMLEGADLRALPLAPMNPLGRIEQMRAARTFHSGVETLRDAGDTSRD
jgi:hypothetical protein